MAERSVSGGKGAKGTRRRLGRGLDALMSTSAPVRVPATVGEKRDAETAAQTEPAARAAGAAVEASEGAGSEGAGSAVSAVGASADGDAGAVGGLRMVSVSAIVPSPYQPRSVMDEEALEQLSASIRRSGVMQPVLLRANSGGGDAPYELIAGERRWRAAQRAGLTELPALLRELDDETAAEWALIENIQRTDLNPIEEAAALKNLLDRFGLTQAELAERTAKDRSSVANLVRLMELEDEVQAHISAGTLTAGHGKALLSMVGGMLRVKMAQRCVDERWSVRQLDQAVKAAAREGASGAGVVDPQRAHAQSIRDEHRRAQRVEIEALEKRLGEHLGTKVNISLGAKGKGGKIELVYFDLDHFDGLMGKMGFAGWEER